MKKAINKLLFFLTVALLFAACSKDDDKRNADASGFSAETKMSAQADAIADDISGIVNDQYDAQDQGRMSQENITSFLPDCATVTTVVNGDTWQRTVNFGTTGCQLYNGNILQGSIIISGTNDFDAAQQTINYSFVNFYHNGRHIEGNKYATRVAGNANGNPQSTIVLDLTITFFERYCGATRRPACMGMGCRG